MTQQSPYRNVVELPETVCPRPDSQALCIYPICSCAVSYLPADRIVQAQEISK